MFTDYPLAERVLTALSSKGFTLPTAIQVATLPHALAGRDIIGQARTGTGKTLAFALPIANRFDKDKKSGRAPRAFILTPTRELALQVAGELEWAAPHLQTVAVYGGTGYGRQASQLKRGADVVVATPGRAIDYLKRNILNLAFVEIAILDEADEMLSMGFEEDVELLLSATPKERQTMLFSATLPRWAKKISEQHLKDPFSVNLITQEEVSYEEIAIEVQNASRLGVLSDVLHAHSGARSIVFTHTKAEVDELAQALSLQGHTAEAIHGDLNQVQRERVVGRFRTGQVSALIGTNVAARGLDIPEVDLVVHYRIPNEADSYQHRSGRTGRAGREGTVVLFYNARERRDLGMLERGVSRRFKRQGPPQPQEIQGAKLESLVANATTQSDKDKAIWQGVAEQWVKEKDTDVIAGLLAMLLGGAPEQRSLLTGEAGWLTMKLAGRIANVPQVVRMLKSAGAGELGRIQLASDGAFVDLRPDSAVKPIEDGYQLFEAKEVTPAPAPKGRSGKRDRGQRQRSRAAHR